MADVRSLTSKAGQSELSEPRVIGGPEQKRRSLLTKSRHKNSKHQERNLYCVYLSRHGNIYLFAALHNIISTSLELSPVMAEAVAAQGFATSILQVIGDGNRVINRLKDFRSSIVEAPKAFRDILVQLSLILDTLERTRQLAESGAFDITTQYALLPVVQGCDAQIAELHQVLAKVMPDKTGSSLQRSKKAIQSVGQEKTVKEISSTLRNYVQTLTYHQATGQRSCQSQAPATYFRSQADKSFFGVPFDRDRKFIGRLRILKQVEDAITNCRNIALAGIGGVG